MNVVQGAASRRESLRERLIKAAERAIAAEGLGGIKARPLAEQAGCAVGAIYNLVADLDELILLANGRTLAALESALASAVTRGRGPDWAIDQLVRLAVAYLAFASTNRLRWRTLFDHHLPAGKTVPQAYRDAQNGLFAYVERPVQELMPAITPERRALLARSLFSAVHGLIALGLEEKLQAIPLPLLREQVTTVVSAMGYGIAGSE
jgi:AcrR family transcriptional regulator